MSDVIVGSSRARVRWPVRRRGAPANSCDGPEATPVDGAVARLSIRVVSKNLRVETSFARHAVASKCLWRSLTADLSGA